MRLHELPTGEEIDLDRVVKVGKLFVNKNYPEYNCYEVYMDSGESFGVFENALARTIFLALWSGTVS